MWPLQSSLIKGLGGYRPLVVGNWVDIPIIGQVLGGNHHYIIGLDLRVGGIIPYSYTKYRLLDPESAVSHSVLPRLKESY